MTKARDIASAAPAPSTVSATEIGYLDGVTSAIQTQIDGKQAANANVSTTELGYLDGVTSAIQTQLDAKIPKTLTTTTGDIIYASSANTPARLGIGSTSQVLTVSGGVPTWATPAGGGSGLTLIQRSTFSNVANTGTTFDSVFTSTYKAYQVVIEELYGVTADNDPVLEMLYSGSVQGSDYYGAAGGATYNSTVFDNVQNSNTAQFTFGSHIGNSDYISSGILWFAGVGNTSEKARWTGVWQEPNDGKARFIGGSQFTARTYTGFRLRSSSTNVTGKVAVYGLAVS